MRTIRFIAIGFIGIFYLASCSASRGIKSADDILDDGKRNVVVMTYDVKLYVTNKYNTVRRTTLNFRCPEDGPPLSPNCFWISVPYKGVKQVGRYNMHAFERSGSTVVGMKYGDYLVGSTYYGVLVDRIRFERCYYDRKTKREECNTDFTDVYHSYSTDFINPLAISVAPGGGCYAGHLTLTIRGDDLMEFEFNTAAELDTDKLRDQSEDFNAALLRFIDRPCS